jgi:molybdenum cofactor cytidylyltransferase
MLEREIGRTKVRKVINQDWKEGMGSSVVRGLNELIKSEESVDGVIFMMCDQPFVTSELLNKLIDTHRQTGRKIVTSVYDGVSGPPAFFEKSFFGQLLMLKGDAGAKQIIQQNPEETASVPFPGGKFDIDTEADYNVFIHSTGGK